MRFSFTTTIAALAVLANAVPSGQRSDKTIPITKNSRLSFRNADQTVNFDVLHNHVSSVKTKIIRGFDNFAKNTGKTHPSAPIKGVVKRQYTEALEYGDTLYYGTIEIGTPTSLFTVVVDTAFTDLLVGLAICDSTCDGRYLWEPISSSTAHDLGQTFDIDRGNGSTATGEQYSDVVWIGNYAATQQTIGGVTDYGSGFQNPHFPADGVMGMAYTSISNYYASSVFQTIYSEGRFLDPVFSVKLAHSGGEMEIDGSNPALYTGVFSYASVTTQGYWEITMDNIRGYGDPILTNIDCIIDTGASPIIGPPADVSKLHTALGGQPAPSSYGQGYWTLPCDSFQVLYLTFDGSPFPIPPAAYNFGPISSDSTDCLTGIVGQEVGSSWILGDVFLRNVYTRFDIGNNSVGFAQLA